MDTYRNPQATISQRVRDLLSRMTLTEKAGQLNQFLFGWKCYRKTAGGFELTEEFCDAVRGGRQGLLYGLLRADPWSGATFHNGIRATESAQVANMVQRFAIETSRFGIPLLLSEECPHGHMALDGTLFPTNLGAICSWNPDLYLQAMACAGSELRARGTHLGYVSVLDLARDPRWGRCEETLGEDPFLAARFAEAAVRGLQGNSGLEAGRAGATVKHFMAQGEASGGHNGAAAVIGEREAREIHLPPFQAAAAAGALSLMAAYNEIDGIPCNANRKLLEEMARRECGFGGFVVSDGGAIDQFTELFGATLPEAAAKALEAGVDVSLWNHAFLHLEEAVEQGLAGIETLDAAVARVLEAKFRFGLFENPYTREDAAAEIVGCAAHRETSLQLARESLVLLKNQGILPLAAAARRIAVLGPNADHAYNQLGDYTPAQRDSQVTTILQGIQAFAQEQTEVIYRHGCGITSQDSSELAEAVRVASEADIAILCLGGASTRDFGMKFDTNGAAIPGEIAIEMDCGEGMDASSLRLPGRQMELFHAVAATGVPVVVVLVQGRPYAIPEIDAQAGAILAAWYPGQEGGTAVAEVLFGRVNPSGKLCISMPRSEGQLPVYYNYKLRARPNYYDQSSTPLYPFGHGLSYTQFRHSNLRIEPAQIPVDGRCKVTVTVENTGAVAGAEVTQLYIRDKVATIVRRIRELKGLHKTFLQPGEKAEVEFELGPEELGLWNPAMQWAVEPGAFTVSIGHDAETALAAELLVVAPNF